MATHATEEVSRKTASDYYDCDHCDGIIPEGTTYVRVALVRPPDASRTRSNPSALPQRGIEKYHGECWAYLEHLEEVGGA